MSLRDVEATPYSIPGPAGLPRGAPRAAAATPAAPRPANTRFATPTWAAALAGLRPPLITSLALLRARALAGDPSKAPALPVLLAALTRVGKDAVVTLADPTAALPATLHAAALEEHGSALRPGAVLVLTDVCAAAAPRDRRASGFRQDRAAGVEMSVHPSNITSVVEPDADAAAPPPADPLLAYTPDARAPLPLPPRSPSYSYKRPRTHLQASPMRTGGSGGVDARGLRVRRAAPPRPAPRPAPRNQRPPRPRAPPVVSDEALDDLLCDVDIEAAIAASGRATQTTVPATSAAAATSTAPTAAVSATAVAASAAGSSSATATGIAAPSRAAAPASVGFGDDDDDLLGDIDIDAMVAASGRSTQSFPGSQVKSVVAGVSVFDPSAAASHGVYRVGSRDGEDHGVPINRREAKRHNGGASGDNLYVQKKHLGGQAPAAAASGREDESSRASSILDLLEDDEENEAQDDNLDVEARRRPRALEGMASPVAAREALPTSTGGLKARKLTAIATGATLVEVDNSAPVKDVAGGKEICIAGDRSAAEPSVALDALTECASRETAVHDGSEEQKSLPLLSVRDQNPLAPTDASKQKPQEAMVPDDAMMDDLLDDLGDDDFGDF